MRTYRSFGTICVKGPYNLVFALCDIEYILKEDDSFRYVFKPNYNVIELLDSKYFQGIPGLNLDLKEKKYIRDNMIPTFISERVPMKNREDYNELLELVGMDYMDPIEYLIRTKDKYCGDNLFVVKKIESTTINLIDETSKENNNALIKKILTNLCIGNNVIINDQIINDSNRKIFYDVFIAIYGRTYNNNKDLQKKGILEAKAKGNFKGRKPISVDELKFLNILEEVKNKKISPKEAASKLGISIDKYYRLKNKLKSTTVSLQ